MPGCSFSCTRRVFCFCVVELLFEATRGAVRTAVASPGFPGAVATFCPTLAIIVAGEGVFFAGSPLGIAVLFAVMLAATAQGFMIFTFTTFGLFLRFRHFFLRPLAFLVFDFCLRRRCLRDPPLPFFDFLPKALPRFFILCHLDRRFHGGLFRPFLSALFAFLNFFLPLRHLRFFIRF